MRFKNPIVDRIWLGLIALSYCFWLVLMIDRDGWRAVATLFFMAFLWYRLRGA
jgi:hypothetical protein